MIAAVVTSFRPSADVVKNIERIAKQVDLVVLVVDDASAADLQQLSVVAEIENVHVLPIVGNVGIATALNRGVDCAHQRSEDFDWLIFFDDDTCISSNFVSRYINYVQELPNTESAVYGCDFRGDEQGKIDNSRKIGVITSGMLLKYRVFNLVGRFEDELFIDGVDYEYCMRARRIGIDIVSLSGLGLVHSLGISTTRRLLGFNFNTTTHSPVRRYYFFRNSVILTRRYFFREPKYVIGVIFSFMKILFSIILCEGNKSTNMKHVLKGVLHGLLGRTGPTYIGAANSRCSHREAG